MRDHEFRKELSNKFMARVKDDQIDEVIVRLLE